MAKYAISEEGISCLEKLAQNLKLASANIDEESMKLYSTVDGFGEDLGIYHKEILELIRNVVNINKASKDEVEYLANKRIPQLKEIIFAFICNGMGDDSSADDEEPAQKKLVLKRR